MIKTIFLVLLLCLCAIGEAMAGPLSLQGVTVTGTNSGGGFATGSTQVVDPDVPEFLTNDGTFNPSTEFFFIDFSESGLVTVFSNQFEAFTSPANQLLTFSFTGLGESIVGFQLDDVSQISSGLSASDLSVINNSEIGLDLSNIAFSNAFSTFSAQLIFAPVATVPEPGSLALFGFALAALFGLRARKPVLFKV